jgi:hypothetical protein
MKIYFYILVLASLFSSCGKKENNNKNTNHKKLEYRFPSAKEYTPLGFIKAAKKTVNDNPLNFINTQNDFPEDWITPEDIDSLISIIDSKEKCNCYKNPLSSYIPNDSAETGGFAIEFIKAFKENKKVDLGLYSCPKVNKEEAEELKKWWRKHSN